MKEIRPSQTDDQEKAQKAFEMIIDLINKHPEIECTLWASAVWSTLVNGYIESHFSYDEFYGEVLKVAHHYKYWWDNVE